MDRIPTPDQRVKVFLSSSLVELVSERDAVRRAIKSQGFCPVPFDVGATPDSPQDVYRQWLEQSNIYVGIFWQSYGQVIPELGISGIEDEFNIASELKKDRLVYFREPASSADSRLVALRRRIEAEGQICYKTFASAQELARLVKQDVARVVSRPFLSTADLSTPSIPDNLLSQVLSRMQKEHYLVRPDAIANVEKLIAPGCHAVLVGEPGVGKTFLLGAVGKKSGALYVPLRGRSPLQVYAYLACRLRQGAGRRPEAYANADSALLALEASLQNSSATVIIDDADQNADVARQLLGLEPYRNAFLLAARSADGLRDGRPAIAHVEPFSEQEIDEYLKLCGMDIAPSRRIELIHASQGNPLYLYYFTHFSVDPLPDGLATYQSELLRRLDAIPRGLIGLIGMSLFQPSLDVLARAHQALTQLTLSPVEVEGKLSEVRGLLDIADGRYALFHPYFRESVRNEARLSGLDRHYHQSFGEVHYEDGRVVEATYHLLQTGDSRADESLLTAADSATMMGLWDIAESFLLRNIKVSQKRQRPRMEGISHYRLAFILRDRAQFDRADAELDAAVQAFEASGSAAWLQVVRMEKCLGWALRAKGEEAVESLRELLGQQGSLDSLWRAVVLVNLAFAYQETGHFREGADAAKSAYDIFTKEGDTEGVITSLTNLTACLGQLDQHDLAEPYARAIIKLGTDLGRPRIRAAGLNQLASSLRAKDDPKGAAGCLIEAIGICQQLGMVRSEITNILNLGNAYKDMRDWANAEKCYQEGLARAVGDSFGSVVAHALYLLCQLRTTQTDHAGALDYANRAVEASLKAQQPLRAAQSRAARARSLASLDRHGEAAESYEKAARGLVQIGYWRDAASCDVSASSEWILLGKGDKSLRCINRSLSMLANHNDLVSAVKALEEVLVTGNVPGLHGQFRYLLERFITAPHQPNLARLLCAYSTYCKRNYDPESARQYRSALTLLSQHASAHHNVVSALVVAVEQADERLLDQAQLYELALALTGTLQGFSCRVMPNGNTIWTAIWQQSPPVVIQIVCLSEKQLARRLSLSLALGALAGECIILGDIRGSASLKGRHVSYMLVLHADFEKHVKKLPDGAMVDETPAIMYESNYPFSEPQPQLPIIVHDSYSLLADWSVHPENKALVWLFMNFYSATVEHLTHRRGRGRAAVAKRALQFCEALLGYRYSERNEQDFEQVRWQVGNLEAVLRGLRVGLVEEHEPKPSPESRGSRKPDARRPPLDTRADSE